MLIDIIILPPPGVLKKLKSLAGQLPKQLRYKAILDRDNLIPHLSLFHLRVRKADIPVIQRRLRDIVKKHSKFPLTLGKVVQGGEGISLLVSKSSPLVRLHSDIVQQLSLLRSGNMPDEFPARTKTDREQQQKYGVQKVLVRYHPHITLALLGEKIKIAALPQLRSSGRIFLADTVAIAIINKYWQVPRVISKYKLFS